MLICNSHSVKGISVGSKEFKILQYADDTVLFLDGTAASFCNALHVLDLFGNCSGLKINIQKNKRNLDWGLKMY